MSLYSNDAINPFLNLAIKLKHNTIDYFKYRRCLKTEKDTTFMFNNKKFNYNRVFSNLAFSTERSIEIPIILDFIKKYNNKEILEVGNVLNHYAEFPHTVVDKYEKSENVINEDIIDFNPNKKYDLIVTISTLEHIGLDEEDKDKFKTLTAISKMLNLLKKNGKLIVSIPLGHNKDLDGFIKNGQIKCKEMYLMERISKDNKWVERPIDSLNTCDIRYNYPYRFGNWILFMVINK